MADYKYITSSGVIIPDTAELRAAVEDEFRSVFGQDLDVSPETPQGVLITMETENRDAVVRNNAELANQINPDIAGGVFLDAIWALTGGQRRDATQSILTQVEFGGVPGTIIPKGSLAETKTGDQFATTKPLIIGKDGKITGDMRAVETGPVECPAGKLNTVASSVLGWETVSNPTNAVLGRVAESDLQSRRRRKLTLAKNTVSVGEAITSALYELEGVRSLAYRENYTDTPMSLDGITLVPHSVYVCVEGGESGEIARALLRTKTIGAAFNGSEEIEVPEPVSGQIYTVKFDRAKEIVLFCRVTVKQTPLDAQTIIPAAVESWARGETEGDGGLVVGREVSPFEIAAGINASEPRLFVTRVELSPNGTDWSSDTYPVKLTEVAGISRSAVQVVFV
ncbi:baseplate J/gp47 family protein [Morganella morganii]|uniref:baseplate J/gp47 family protein n=1 Tax=Morganella morganii TaxID=582 RepID=UPI001BD99919|nr:baseplate J/gp47 family protein [Morganella morganii]ELA8729025.1 baseplate J/gp47 family protein [Morganella morganii]ELB1849338.1 baseplate J/gp47 family protein [Morganella morganii]MBT0490775.1 baseplate J/gp47 family protein [Morganella morganii subsp. morganii]MBT0493501.1 baseplate J/gp47 family protein [Morganella morganii subsp. morganii]QWL94785.1 baseplate J/gp47 family protein [Morganella morganii subsp. morganii]